MNIHHGQVQLWERGDAKVGSYSPGCLDVLNPGPIDQGTFDGGRFAIHNGSAHEATSREILCLV